MMQYMVLLPFYDIVHIHFSLPPSAYRKYTFFKLAKMMGKTRGMFPNWTFTDTTDIMETNRRINVGKCFIAAVRKRR